MRAWTMLLCALLALPTVALAGGLTPPGAPAPTMKTLDQVEPRIPVGFLTTPGDADSSFKITQPGSYYLTADFLGRAGFYGVEIASNDVTLDLMGYTLRGVAGSRSGVFTTGGAWTGVKVHGGVVRDWDEYGVRLSGEGSLASDLRLIGNGFSGLSIRSGRVEGCTARENGGGFDATQATVFLNCTAEDNLGAGFCVGITASVINCTALSNDGHGVIADGASTIVNCASQQNGGDGYSLGFGSSLAASVARFNTGSGAVGGSGASIIGNAFDRNEGNGVQVSSRALVMDNNCTQNSLAGVLCTGTDSRIDGNKLMFNNRGVDVDGFDNLVIRNTAGANTANFDIVTANKVGVIVSAPPSGVIFGATGGGGVGTTDPWANISY